MSSISRRDAIKKGGQLLVAAAAGAFTPPLFYGCAEQDVGPDMIAALMKKAVKMDIENIKITIIYDNFAHAKGLETDWGFACLVEGLDKTILFDAGRYDNTFMSNMDKLKIDPRQIDELVLSHDHPDHIGGVFKMLENRPGLNITLVKSFGSGFKKTLKKQGASVAEANQPCMITNSVLSTGEMKDFVRNEQSLIILTNMGSIILTGCAHPGVVDIVKRTKRITKQEVLLIAGGFHLLTDYGSSLRKIAQQLKDLGVRYVAPSHCTGGEARTVFATVYEKGYLHSGAGRIIRASDFSNA